MLKLLHILSYVKAYTLLLSCAKYIKKIREMLTGVFRTLDKRLKMEILS